MMRITAVVTTAVTTMMTMKFHVVRFYCNNDNNNGKIRHQVNLRNAFFHLPTVENDNVDEELTAEEEWRQQQPQHAIQLMKQVSTRSHHLHEALVLAKEVRDQQEEFWVRNERPAFYT